MAKLILVPVPIGNMADITLRAIEVLKSADVIYCEDTRTTGMLLKYHNIVAKRLQAYHLNNEHSKIEKFSDDICLSDTSVLVSDAGSPSISDPGFMLVRACVEKGVDVEALPGPTALIPALSVSGLSCDRFYFEGFLPMKKGRQKRLEYLSTLDVSVVFYESPHRIVKMFQELKIHFGEERKVCLCREISKMHEEHIRGSIAEVLADIESRQQVKGEIVVVVEGCKNEKNSERKYSDQ